MPQKSKFTREEVIEAALALVRRDGIESLTARSLGAWLGSSARPIFTVFNSMDEVRSEVKDAARAVYERYEDEGMDGPKAFKGSGIGYIRFAAAEPKLFQLLFMNELESVPDQNTVLKIIDNYYDKILNSIQTEYGFDLETSKQVYLHLWIYSHGIATLCATKVCAFSEEEISAMLDAVGAGIIIKYKVMDKK